MASSYITIDDIDIKNSAFWITNQQKPDGCFPLVGSIVHQDLLGGLGNTQGSSVPITAYILISLMEADSISDSTRTNGLSCIASESKPSTYTLALMTYAFALANSSDAKSYLDKLMALSKVNGELQYWENDNPSSLSIQIEIGSYAILTILKYYGSSGATQALPIVRWISKQRNANGGFVSTQDTVMAIQALSKYAGVISKDPLNLSVTATDTSTSFNQTFKVDTTNKILFQSVDFKKVPTALKIIGSGTGCAFVQYTLTYNIPNAAKSSSFSLTVQAVKSSIKPYKRASINVCFSYLVPNKVSNMALLQIKMVSGYSVIVDSITPLFNDKSLTFKRYDLLDNNIAFYFSQVSSKKQCFNFIVNQDIEVTDTKPATAVLSDYYQPENIVSVDYSIVSTQKT